jgi:exonuclease III
LQSAARSMSETGVDIAFIQEVKITDPRFATKRWAGYDIRTSAAGTAHCGGVALLVREDDDYTFTVENEKVVGANVISFEMVTGRHKRWFVVGCCIPPSDRDDTGQHSGWWRRPLLHALEGRARSSSGI